VSGADALRRESAGLQSVPARPKYCWTAVIGVIGLVPFFGFVVIVLPLLVWFGAGFEVRENTRPAAESPQLQPGENVPPVPASAPAEGLPLSPAQRTLMGASWAIICAAVVPLACAIWTTVFGIVAVVQIRRAKGQLRGMGLAVFDVVFFPILAFVVLVLGVAACA
jgi:hypothetical protein